MSQDSSGIFNPLRARSSFDNFFGVVNTDVDPDPVAPAKSTGGSFLEQYKKGLDPSVAVNLNPALGALLPTDPVRGSAISPNLVKLPGAVRHESAEPSFGNMNSAFARTAVSDLNTTVLNQWNPLYTGPKLELPKLSSPSPAVSAFELPRRHF